METDLKHALFCQNKSSMSFIDSRIQGLIFDAMRVRREKRDICLGDFAPEEHRKSLDKCLDMILCHDPDVWSHGTGLLLVAPKTKSATQCTQSQRTAWLERTHVMQEHLYAREFRRLHDEGFGFFVRRTLEYRNRMLNLWGRDDAYTSCDSIDAIQRFGNGFSKEFEDFSIQTDYALEIGLMRHGAVFSRYRSVTKGQSDSQIVYKIEHGTRECPNIDALRCLLYDRFPDLFDDYDLNLENGEWSWL